MWATGLQSIQLLFAQFVLLAAEVLVNVGHAGQWHVADGTHHHPLPSTRQCTYTPSYTSSTPNPYPPSSHSPSWGVIAERHGFFLMLLAVDMLVLVLKGG
jgi:hypothetical protein